MGLVKRTYVDGETVITAENLNAIQDAIIANEEAIEDQGEALDHKADVIYDTASGDIASFPDGADGLPVKDLTVAIEPVQSGTGDPSPTNVRPISGWTGANVARTGKNLFSAEAVSTTGAGVTITPHSDGSFTINGTPTSIVSIGKNAGSFSRGAKAPEKLRKGLTYTLSGGHWASTQVAYIQLIYKGDSTGTTYSLVSSNSTYTITMTEDATLDGIYVNFQANKTFSNDRVYPQFEISTTATAYEPYSCTTIPISWQSEAGTVYGGTLDVTSGVLTVDRGISDLGALDWKYSTDFARFESLTALNNVLAPDNYNSDVNAISSIYKVVPYDQLALSDHSLTIIFKTSAAAGKIWIKDSRYSDATTFKTAVTGQKIVYPIVQPTVIQLDPVTISTLLGQNNIWADCGPSTVEYLADTKTYVDNGIGEVENTLTQLKTDTFGSINLTGTNNTGSTITAGTFFYNNGSLVRAKTDIQNGSAITIGTNAETVTAGGLNEFNNSISTLIKKRTIVVTTDKDGDAALMTMPAGRVFVSAVPNRNYGDGTYSSWLGVIIGSGVNKGVVSVKCVNDSNQKLASQKVAIDLYYIDGQQLS